MENKKAVTRSPGYPSLTLEEAIQKAKVVWEHAKRNPVSAEVVAGYWKYGLKSSGWRLAIAALKKFGLLESVGSKKSGEVKLTALAFRIVLDVRDPSPERDTAVKEAALNPEIYRELWTHWQQVLPSDETVHTYLVLNKGFNEASVAGFIADFKKTIGFAKLAPVDTMSPAGGTVEEEEGEEDYDAPGQGQKRQSGRRAVEPETRSDNYTLTRGQVTLQWPDHIRPEEYEDLVAWLGIMTRKIKQAVRDDDPVEDES